MTALSTRPAKPKRKAPFEAGRLLRALADGNRLRILARLRKGEECVCTLTEALGCAQPLLSHHVKTLMTAGLVTQRRDGRWAYYTVNPDALAFLERFLADLRGPTGPRSTAGRCA